MANTANPTSALDDMSAADQVNELSQQVQKRMSPQAQPSLPPMHQPTQQGHQDQALMMPPRAQGYRTSAIRESRIKDRPVSSKQAGDSALKIKIELDLEVEVDLYARVKGDVTIGLM